MRKHTWEALGTQFSISFGGEASLREEALVLECMRRTEVFDKTFSRYRADSLISRIAQEAGTYEVPSDAIVMLRLYERLYRATGGALTPTVGHALEDIGLDAAYSLKEKAVIRPTPRFEDAVVLLDDTHLTLTTSVLLDLGAVGKGYLVDELYAYLLSEKCAEFLVDGSGDIRYYSASLTPIVSGLEHPYDPSLVLGTFSISSGALCASATNRRRWGHRHHYVNPVTNESPEDIVATWVYAETAALADGLSSALFFVEPEALRDFSFEYVVVNKHLQLKRSAGFTAELF